ncbi:DUF7511 domain-containing protein [Salinirubrum litoreum]|uniref:DUF7511 domain-containing protein n=1 Tax=Salinirubrum litoreum TaxID=1126234 RepID=A0ABD5R8D5_9EURY|nr:hypothetical protein [Salinirubrum litoreum]
MPLDPAGSSGATHPDGASSSATAPHAIDSRDFALHSVVVEYDGRPDRCTIYPRRSRCRDRVASWLSADREAFVGLEEMR